MAKPRITCKPDGPYLLEGGAGVRRSSGQTWPAAESVALCRCGGSTRKPFCDGTHRRNGFTDANLADGTKNKRQAYPGKRITILDNRAICAHAGICTDKLASVFRYGEEPWIVPDGAAADEIMETIRQCPSGALSYAEARPLERAPMITVTADGPYAVTGGIELVGVPFGDGASREHYTLCRCGASKNKPFCDGSHWDAGFKDPT